LRNAAEAAGQTAGKPVVSLAIARTAGGRTTVEVTDNGPGVPESLKQDVFLPFFTTKDSGTGVGLSLARQIVLAHNGSINVGNAPAGGAMFRLVI
jgi:signal transduction histidine kinase